MYTPNDAQGVSPPIVFVTLQPHRRIQKVFVHLGNSQGLSDTLRIQRLNPAPWEDFWTCENVMRHLEKF